MPQWLAVLVWLLSSATWLTAWPSSKRKASSNPNGKEAQRSPAEFPPDRGLCRPPDRGVCLAPSPKKLPDARAALASLRSTTSSMLKATDVATGASSSRSWLDDFAKRMSSKISMRRSGSTASASTAVPEDDEGLAVVSEASSGPRTTPILESSLGKLHVDHV
eukprot:3129776-Prymnesium_polylepis.1